METQTVFRGDREEQVVRLPGGRQLGFGEYGATTGRPIFFFHGIPGSRYFFRLAHSTALQLGVRIIAPERPGYGISDFDPKRSILDWPGDVCHLADYLKIERFCVAGISGGGPYALACGALLRERINALGLISGMGPIDHPEVDRRITSRQRVARFLFRDAPGFVSVLAFMLSKLLKVAPEVVIRFARHIPEPGREVLEDPSTAQRVCEGFSEAFRCGTRGIVKDLSLLTHPWGFSLEEIRVPVFLWHGERDFDVPVMLAKLVAEALPDVEAHFIPEAGHAWIISNFEIVLKRLLLQRVD